MKTYTITINEKQFNTLVVAMESQEEVACDVMCDAHDDMVENDTEETRACFAEYAELYCIARELNIMIREAAACGSATSSVAEIREKRSPEICDLSISSKLFAQDISDYIDGKVEDCLESITRHLFDRMYMMRKVNEQDLQDTAHDLRDGIIEWLTDNYKLIRSDETDF